MDSSAETERGSNYYSPTEPAVANEQVSPMDIDETEYAPSAPRKSRASRNSIELWQKLREAYSTNPSNRKSASAIAAVLELRERLKAQIRVNLPTEIESTLQICDSYTCGLAMDEFLKPGSTSRHK